MLVGGKPCFTKESFEAINKEAKYQSVYYNLVIDEMYYKIIKLYLILLYFFK